MMIFLFIYVYLKCVWIGIVFSWKEKVHEKEPFFHTREKLGFVQASILFQLYMYVYY